MPVLGSEFEFLGCGLTCFLLVSMEGMERDMEAKMFVGIVVCCRGYCRDPLRYAPRPYTPNPEPFCLG